MSFWAKQRATQASLSEQQLQVYIPVGARILGDKEHLSPGPVSIHYNTVLQIVDINLIAALTRPNLL